MGFRIDRAILLRDWKGSLKTVGIIQPIQGLVNFPEYKAPRMSGARGKQSPRWRIPALFSLGFRLFVLQVFFNPFFEGMGVEVDDGDDFILALFAGDDLQGAGSDSENVSQQLQER